MVVRKYVRRNVERTEGLLRVLKLGQGRKKKLDDLLLESRDVFCGIRRQEEEIMASSQETSYEPCTPSSPVTLAQKPDITIRFYENCKELNCITSLMHYRISREMLKVVSVINLCKCFWQIKSTLPNKVTVEPDTMEVQHFTVYVEDFTRFLPQVPKALSVNG